MKVLALILATSLSCEIGFCSPFPEIIQDRISSREGAEVIAGDLAMAFPDRVTEILEAVGRERPEWVVAAAIAVVRRLPDQSEAAVRGARASVQRELWDSLDLVVRDRAAH